MSHGIKFSPEALRDLIDIYDYIAQRDSAERAIGYIDRIEDCCRNLSAFPERHQARRPAPRPTDSWFRTPRGDCVPGYQRYRNDSSRPLRAVVILRPFFPDWSWHLGQKVSRDQRQVLPDDNCRRSPADPFYSEE